MGKLGNCHELLHVFLGGGGAEFCWNFNISYFNFFFNPCLYWSLAFLLSYSFETIEIPFNRQLLGTIRFSLAISGFQEGSLGEVIAFNRDSGRYLVQLLPPRRPALPTSTSATSATSPAMPVFQGGEPLPEPVTEPVSKLVLLQNLRPAVERTLRPPLKEANFIWAESWWINFSYHLHHCKPLCMSES